MANSIEEHLLISVTLHWHLLFILY